MPVNITDAQLQIWIQEYFWPFARIGGLLMTAPVFGGRSAPARVRLIFALALTMALAPLLPPSAPTPAPLTVFTAAWWLRAAQETALGIAFGFVLQLVFEAVVMGGELIGYGMGLGFARLADPIRGADAPVLGAFLRVAFMLLFFAAGAHLRLIEVLADSFKALPSGASLGAHDMLALARYGAQLFRGALSIALPAVAALLLVNMAFGAMNRSAPTLNAMSVGFPLTLLVGLVMLDFNLPAMSGVLQNLLVDAWALIGALGHGG
jgi:flagellar biosynthetic protein FliR